MCKKETKTIKHHCVVKFQNEIRKILVELTLIQPSIFLVEFHQEVGMSGS